MGDVSDFGLLDDYLPERPNFKDLFALVELERKLIASSADLTAESHAQIRALLEFTIEENWNKWEEADLGGRDFVEFGDPSTWSSITRARNARQVAGRIMKPLDHSVVLLSEAQGSIAKFKRVFLRHMDPMVNPVRARRRPARGFDVDGGF